MALDATAETLMRVMTELNVVRAQQNDLTLKIREGELIEWRKAEAIIFDRARRVRDQLLTAPARHAAILGADFGLGAGVLAHALEQTLAASLRELSRRPK